MKTNKAWHATHRMPKNPTIEQRIAWHLEHRKHCSCRPIPEKLLDTISSAGYGNLPEVTGKTTSSKQSQ